MKIVDYCKYRDADGRIGLLSKVRGTRDLAPGWWREMFMYDQVAERLAGILGDEHVLVKNVPVLLGAGVMLPMVLFSPQGARAIFAGHDPDDELAERQELIASIEGPPGSEPPPMSMLGQVLEALKSPLWDFQEVVGEVAQDLLGHMQGMGFRLPAVEPVILYAKPGATVGGCRANAFGESAKEFGADLERLPAIMDEDGVASLAEALAGRRPTDCAPAMAEQLFGSSVGVRDSKDADGRPSAGRRGSAAAGEIRVLVVDDFLEVRDVVTEVLRSERGMVVVGEAADGLEAIEAYEELRPDVVCMDYRMPRMCGITAANLICQRHPAAGIFMHSVMGEWLCLAAAGLAGALDYLVKPVSGVELVDAVRLIAQAGEADRQRGRSSMEDHLRRQKFERRLVLPRRFKEACSLIGGATDSVNRMLRCCRAMSEGPISGMSAVEEAYEHESSRLSQHLLQAKREVVTAVLADKPPSDPPRAIPMCDLPEEERYVADLKRLLSDAEEALGWAGSCALPEWDLSRAEVASLRRMWLLCAGSELERVEVGQD